MTINTDGTTAGAPTPRDPEDFPLDERAYKRLQPEDLRFIKDLTGITDDGALEKHVVSVQKEAYQVHLRTHPLVPRPSKRPLVLGVSLPVHPVLFLRDVSAQCSCYFCEIGQLTILTSQDKSASRIELCTCREAWEGARKRYPPRRWMLL